MLLELLAFVVVFSVCWYLNFRPRSTNQIRPSYTTCTTPRSVPECDYVVIGAGPAGLSAAATLLECTADDVRVLVVDAGPDLQSSSSFTLLCDSWLRRRLLSFLPDPLLWSDRLPSLFGSSGAAAIRCALHTRLAQRPFFATADGEELLAPTTVAAHSAAGPASTRELEAKQNKYLNLQYTAYPRGTGVGGGALTDWGLHLNSLWPAEDPKGEGNTAAKWACLPTRFPNLRNPLSWAFAEAVKASGLAPPYLPTPAAPVSRGAVFPTYLYLDEDGRRLALPSALLSHIAPEVLQRRLFVLTNHTVVSMASTPSASEPDAAAEGAQWRVDGVVVRAAGGKGATSQATLRVRKGVVVAAGALETPALLHAAIAARSLPRAIGDVTAPTCRVRDVLAMPMVFAAVGAVSADAINARDGKSNGSWWLTQRGPFLAPLCDTVASVRLPSIGPQAELRLVLLPFGGRDATAYRQMGWQTILATPLQAYTLLVVLQGIDGLEHELEVAPPQASAGGLGTGRLCGRQQPPVLPTAIQRKVQEALLIGMRECRKLTTAHPLCDLSLTPGSESVDFTLLVPADKTKALRMAQLSRQLRTKLTARNKVELRELTQWAATVTGTEAYMRSYIDAHAYWLGFASGTSEAYLAAPPPSSAAGGAAGAVTEEKEKGELGTTRVRDFANLVVGDCSAVTTAQWAGVGQRDSLAAGSRSTTMHVAERAAVELLKVVDGTP